MPLFRANRPLNYPPSRHPPPEADDELRGDLGGAYSRRSSFRRGNRDAAGHPKSAASSATGQSQRKVSGLFRRNSLSSMNSHGRGSNAPSVRRSLNSLFPPAADERPRPAQDPIYSGYLAKRGRRSSRLVMRYFVLTGSVLSNHLDDKSPASWMMSVLGAEIDERRERANESWEAGLTLPKSSSGLPHKLLTITLRLRGVVIDLFAQSVLEAEAWTHALIEASTIKPVKGHIAAMPPSSRPRLLRTLSGRNLSSPLYYTDNERANQSQQSHQGTNHNDDDDEDEDDQEVKVVENPEDDDLGVQVEEDIQPVEEAATEQMKADESRAEAIAARNVSRELGRTDAIQLGSM